jgi:hypothetical protein
MFWSLTGKNPGTQWAEGRVATQLVWMFWRKQKSLAPTGIQTTDHQAYSMVAMPSKQTMLLQLHAAHIRHKLDDAGILLH